MYGNTAKVLSSPTKMPSGKTYLQVAQKTYDEAWEQWDTTQCKGGIYWSRDRSTSNTKRGYKSTITNAQHIMLGSRLYLLTKNTTYLANAKLVYTWLKQGIITSRFTVLDGIDGNAGCTGNSLGTSCIP
jgi:mannan endo-1,6-alpha-mannosidase